MGHFERLDYRCRGIGCLSAPKCRRFLTGDAAKNSSAPLAAFDARKDSNDCQAFLARVDIGDIK